MHGQQLQKFEWLVIKICIHCIFVNSKILKQQNLHDTVKVKIQRMKNNNPVVKSLTHVDSKFLNSNSCWSKPIFK